MAPNAKERLIRSVAGGVIIPASFFAVLGVFDALSLSLPSAWILLPVVWPAFILRLMLDAFADDFWFFKTEAALLMVAANFVLYSLLTYAVIRWRQRMPRLR